MFAQRFLLSLLLLPPLLASYFSGYGRLCTATLPFDSLGTSALRPAAVPLVFAARGHLLGSGCCTRGVTAPTSASAQPREAASTPASCNTGIVVGVRPLSDSFGSLIAYDRFLHLRCLSAQADSNHWCSSTHLRRSRKLRHQHSPGCAVSE